MRTQSMLAAVLGASAMAAQGLKPSVDSVSIDRTTVFKDEEFEVSATLSFSDVGTPAPGDYMYYLLTVNGVDLDVGSVLVNGTETELPKSVSATAVVGSAGLVEATVSVALVEADLDSDDAATGGAEAYAIGRGVSLLPLIVVLGLAMLTRRVEFALFMGIFTGAFIINGNSIVDGFKRTLDQYILGAAADVDHQYVILFTLFLSGLVGMMERSGGVAGLTQLLSQFARTPQLGQFVAVAAGMLVFFDDYSNALVVGSLMRPIMDMLSVSREKLAFLVDATSAPVASLVPISSWTGFEADLLNKELAKIVARNGGATPEGLPATGYGLLLESIPYRFYLFLMIFFQLLLIALRREFGPMLIAERKVRVYERTDGGDGADRSSKGLEDRNAPEEDTPKRAWNMLVPVASLVFFILFVMGRTGLDAVSEKDSYDWLDVISNADSYSGLLYGTAAASIFTFLFFQFQWKSAGSVVPPSPAGCRAALQSSSSSVVSVEDAPQGYSGVPKPLLGPNGSLDAWLDGMTTVFPAVVVLVLAWSVAAIMGDIGTDRIFYDAIVGNDIKETLPALTFALSALVALCTGTSWGTMGIMYTLVLVPAWDVSDGDKAVLLGTVGAVLSGAVAGDHASIISDTTILSSIATRCDLWRHFWTQAPYALFVFLVSMLMGYLPVGTGNYPAGAALAVGALVLGALTFLISAPVESESGKLDPLTELYAKISKNPALAKLKEDTASFYANGGGLPTGKVASP